MGIDRQEVIEAATRLLAVNPGASTTEIAAAASISRASLHRLFPSRDALVEQIAALAVGRVTAAIAAARPDDGPALDAVARLTDAVVPLVHQFAFLATEGQVRRPARARKDRGPDAVLLRLFRRGQAEGVLRQDLPAAWLLRAYGGLLYGLALASRSGDVVPHDAPRLVLSTFTRGATGQHSSPSRGQRSLGSRRKP